MAHRSDRQEFMLSEHIARCEREANRAALAKADEAEDALRRLNRLDEPSTDAELLCDALAQGAWDE